MGIGKLVRKHPLKTIGLVGAAALAAIVATQGPEWKRQDLDAIVGKAVQGQVEQFESSGTKYASANGRVVVYDRNSDGICGEQDSIEVNAPIEGRARYDCGEIGFGDLARIKEQLGMGYHDPDKVEMEAIISRAKAFPGTEKSGVNHRITSDRGWMTLSIRNDGSCSQLYTAHVELGRQEDVGCNDYNKTQMNAANDIMNNAHEQPENFSTGRVLREIVGTGIDYHLP